MALQTTTAPSSGVWGAIKGALGIFSDINKAGGVSENTNPEPIEEYKFSFDEEETIKLTSQWKRTYDAYYQDVEASQTLSFEYWIGKQQASEPQDTGNQLLVDNKIFEAIETFIPIATRANPDPLIQADPGDLGDSLSSAIKTALVREADRMKLRKLLKGALRNWIICRLGVLKVAYNLELEQIETFVIHPKRMIFDKDGHWDEAGNFTGEYIGEKKKVTAKELIAMFPHKQSDILLKAGMKKGTKVEFIEWWYKGIEVFYTMEEVLLGKFKNPHWNYDAEDEGINHLDKPTDPYIGLSIFTTQLQPHDETSLVLQNIGIQDMINRRWRQLDKNVEAMNNGLVISDRFTDEQASLAASALRKGIAIRAPGDDVTKAVMRFPAPALPGQVYEMLQDGRSEVANIFGTSGSTPQGLDSQDTVRGKILTNQLDSTRIGGGITEYLEQMADTTYNKWVQLMFVHYTDPHYFVSAGSIGGAEIIQIKNTDLGLLKTLDITVKEGSLIPKDPLTQRNEAIDLWSANAIDPLTFYKRLDFADPVESATQLLTWQLVQKGVLPPQSYLPNFQQPVQTALPQQGVGGPAVNPVGPQTPSAPPEPATQGAVGAESKQLIQSIPAK